MPLPVMRGARITPLPLLLFLAVTVRKSPSWKGVRLAAAASVF
jgi:hypothetical protein